MPGAIKFLPNGSILAEVVLNPAQSLVLVSLQEAPHSLAVHPVLVAEGDGWEQQLETREILSSPVVASTLLEHLVARRKPPLLSNV